jgi:hypothetical protein
VGHVAPYQREFDPLITTVRNKSIGKNGSLKSTVIKLLEVGNDRLQCSFSLMECCSFRPNLQTKKNEFLGSYS